MGNRYYQVALNSNNKADLIWAYTILCLNSWYQGGFREAIEYAETGLNLYKGKKQSAEARLYSVESSTTTIAHKSMALWFLGYPDQSQMEMQNALTLATGCQQPFLKVRILTYFCCLNFLRRDVREVCRYAEQIMGLSNEHGFTYYISHGLVFKGWAELMQGKADAGLELISQGIGNHQAAGAILIRNLFLGIQAEAFEVTGRIQEGLGLIDEALSLVNEYGERFYEAELHRIKAELLLKKSFSGTREAQALQDAAENGYHQAIKVADRQGAKSLELRACLSLSRLYIQKEKQIQAQELLKQVYERFTEGFENKDLIETRGMLEKLAGQSKPID